MIFVKTKLRLLIMIARCRWDQRHAFPFNLLHLFKNSFNLLHILQIYNPFPEQGGDVNNFFPDLSSFILLFLNLFFVKCQFKQNCFVVS